MSQGQLTAQLMFTWDQVIISWRWCCFHFWTHSIFYCGSKISEKQNKLQLKSHNIVSLSTKDKEVPSFKMKEYVSMLIKLMLLNRAVSVPLEQLIGDGLLWQEIKLLIRHTIWKYWMVGIAFQSLRGIFSWSAAKVKHSNHAEKWLNKGGIT